MSAFKLFQNACICCKNDIELVFHSVSYKNGLYTNTIALCLIQGSSDQIFRTGRCQGLFHAMPNHH